MEAAESQPPAVSGKQGGVVIPHRARWYQRLAAWAIYTVIRCIDATIRWEFEDEAGVFGGASTERVIFCIWHNRLALSLAAYRRYVQRFEPGRRMAAMVSASRDGGMLARILELFDVEPVRGSSSRRGPQALRELATFGERGLDLAITPDGPRGPCYRVQEGVIHAAQLTGLPIVPVSCYLSWKVRPRSWDRFQIPLPFSRCRVKTGTIVRVAREVSDEERNAHREQLERTLIEITVD